MKFTRKALCALGIALALIATPAWAGWKTFGLNGIPGGGQEDASDQGGGAEDDPTELPPDITEVDTDPTPPEIADIEVPKLGEEPGPLPTQLVIDSEIPGDYPPQTAQVPEPATLSLVALGLLGLGWKARRRRT